jgi:hypothetical protein
VDKESWHEDRRPYTTGAPESLFRILTDIIGLYVA